MKVALVYDRVNKWGGAERVLLALHKIFPKAPLYTSVYNRKKAPWARAFKVKYSLLQHLPFASSAHEYYALLMPKAFESFDFNKFDLVVSVTSEAAKGIKTSPKTLHVCYCLTPTRYLWSSFGDYFKNPILRVLSVPAVWYLKKWDLIAAKRPDAYIAISEEVRKRINKYYKRPASVAYPPVTLGESFKGKGESKKRSLRFTLYPSPFYLVVSRLVLYKRVDIAIEACNRLKLPLKIVGTGSEEKKLKALAGKTIEFVGSLTDEKLVEYYKGCKALIFPGIEDFGLTAVEAQSFGKPVIAFKGGGAWETIVEGKTGMFFPKKTVGSLVSVLKQFEKKRFSQALCRKQAKKFSLAKFEKQFKRELNRIQKK